MTQPYSQVFILRERKAPIHMKIYISIFKAALFIIINDRKLKFSPPGEWIYKVWFIFSRHTDIQQQKRSKLLTHTKCVNCKGNAERKKSAIYRMISFIMIFTKRYNYYDSRQFSGCRWLKVEEWYTHKMKAQGCFLGDRTNIL